MAISPIAVELGFIEGPVAMPDGRIMFADVSGGCLMAYDPSTAKISQFAVTRGGPNGVARGPDGGYYVCNNGGLSFRRSSQGFLLPIAGTKGDMPVAAGIQRVSPDGEVEQLYTECSGRSLVAPNDLVFDTDGGFYFTDTGHPSGRLTDLGGLYYAKSDGSHIEELLHESAVHVPLSQPNGCGLSPDGKRLYAVETGGARLWAWDIVAPGRLLKTPDGFTANGAQFIYGAGGYQMFDSLAIDGDGNICIATIMRGGISVVSPTGELIEFVDLPIFDPFPTNICFAGDGLREAYVTAAGTGKLYHVDWPRAGLKLNYAD